MPRWIRYGGVGLIIAAILLLVVMVTAGTSSAMFERWFPTMLILDTAAVAVLLVFIVVVVARLARRYHAGVYGSRLTGRLALAIALIAVFPCLLIYLVSSQFIGRSIDSWFDVRVEHALDSGVTLSGEIIGREQSRLERLASQLSRSLPRTAPGELQKRLDALRADRSLDAVFLLRADASILLSSLPEGSAIPAQPPTPDELRRARDLGAITIAEGDAVGSDGRLRLRSLAYVGEVRGPDGQSGPTFAQLTQRVPDDLAEAASDLVNGFRDYQELVLSRHALRNIYGITLTLTMLMGALGAIGLTLAFAGTVTAPILQLAHGTRRVASGDLRPIREFSGSDEINDLTRSFNSMVGQLAEARNLAAGQREEVERSRDSLAQILSNISSGVLVVDEGLTVQTINAAATAILGNRRLRPGARLTRAEPDLARAIAEQTQLAREGENLSVEFELARDGNSRPLTLFLRGARLSTEAGPGWVIVLDDISDLVNAQKALAWGEVASRLAHEIKNPLTPIRLAAERLDLKLADKLADQDATLLRRACRTIVTQADAMKKMVDDFRSYARLPSAELKPISLVPLLEETCAFYSTGGAAVKLRRNPSRAEIMGDDGQLRQVLHNLIGNSLEACADRAEARVSLSLRQLPRDAGLCLTVEDNGSGFSQPILARAFEPYTTTKPTGTGLGLPMVAKILKEHGARIELGNIVDAAGKVQGARVTITFPPGPSSPSPAASA